MNSFVRRTNYRIAKGIIIPLPGDVLKAKCIAWLLLAARLKSPVSAIRAEGRDDSAKDSRIAADDGHQDQDRAVLEGNERNESLAPCADQEAQQEPEEPEIVAGDVKEMAPVDVLATV
jgi:hypothetical protein